MTSFRFTVSSPLGKLAKWLRILGFDTVYEPDAATECCGYREDKGRIIIRRSHSKKGVPRIVENRVVVCSDHPLVQLQEVIRCLHITPQMIQPFTLCIQCNQKTQTVERATVKGRVPDYVWTSTNAFRMCPECRRIYWAGSHLERTQQRIDQLFKPKTA